MDNHDAVAPDMDDIPDLLDDDGYGGFADYFTRDVNKRQPGYSFSHDDHDDKDDRLTKRPRTEITATENGASGSTSTVGEQSSY